MAAAESSAYEELHREAEAQGLIVCLGLEDTDRRPSKLGRLTLLDRSGEEVASLRLTVRRDLEATAFSLLMLLVNRRERA